MNKFEKEYLSLFNQQKEEEKTPLVQQGKQYNALKKKVGTLSLDNIFSKYDVFKDQSLPYSKSEHVGYETLEDYELPVEVQLTDGKTCQVKFNGEIQIEYSWSEYQPSSWDSPGNQGGIEEISAFGYPFEKSLNSKANDDIILVSVTTFDGETTTPKFSELSQKDQLLVFEEISDYFNSEEFFTDEFPDIVGDDF